MLKTVISDKAKGNLCDLALKITSSQLFDSFRFQNCQFNIQLTQLFELLSSSEDGNCGQPFWGGQFAVNSKIFLLKVGVLLHFLNSHTFSWSLKSGKWFNLPETVLPIFQCECLQSIRLVSVLPSLFLHPNRQQIQLKKLPVYAHKSAAAREPSA